MLMIMFGSNQSNSREDNWRRRLDQFVKENQQELAALSWGLWLENGDSQGSIGLNLHPKPQFVYCPKAAIETFNSNVEDQLREILGIVDNHQAEKEVLIIGIGNDQIKLIHFEPQPAPPVCFEQVAANVDTLLAQLEQRLHEQINC